MIVQFLGRHGKVLKSVRPPIGWEGSVLILDELPDERKEHFPPPAGFPLWDPKRKVSDLREKAE